MPAQAKITTRVPLPPSLPPEPVIAALHAFEPLITANPFVVRFERQPVHIPDLVADPFFRADGIKLQAYVVHDRVPVIPGITKAVEIPCCFQSFGAGTRCRADAVGGVTVRSSYEVRRRGEVPLGAGEKEVEEGGDGYEWELVEVAEIECGVMVKPFVTRSFSSAHKEILQRVVDEVVKGHQGGIMTGQRWG